MECSPISPPERLRIRRLRRILATTLVLFLTTNIFLSRNLAGWSGTAVAAFTGLLFFGILLLTALLVMRTLDEFQQALMIRSFLWGTFITMGIAAVWGYVEEVPGTRLPHLPLAVVPAALTVVTTLAKLLIFRRHQSPHEKPPSPSFSSPGAAAH